MMALTLDISYICLSVSLIEMQIVIIVAQKDDFMLNNKHQNKNPRGISV